MQTFFKVEIATLLMLSASGCSSHLYYDQAMQYVKAIEAVLIEADQCSSAADCQAKQLIFFEAGGIAIGPVRTGGVALHVYQQSEGKLIASLGQKVAAIRSNIGGPSVTLTVYANKHSERTRVLQDFKIK